MHIFQRLAQRVRTMFTDFWLGLAEDDIKSLRHQLAELPRAAQIEILDAGRRHAAELKSIERKHRAEEIRLDGAIKQAEYTLDCMLEDIRPSRQVKVYDFTRKVA